MDYLRDISLFVAVAEEQSFTRAALRLAMPTSTLSRRIAALERSLGLPLLNRNTRTVELTEAGTLYLARCQPILEAAHDAHRDVSGLVAAPGGVLRMSIEAETGPRLVAPVIAAYLERYPDVSIELDLSPRRVDLLGEGFDLAIRIGTLPDSSLTVRRLAQLRGGLFASPAYLDRFGTPAHPSELAEHRRIHLLHKGDRGEWRLANADTGKQLEIHTGRAVSANNMTMIRQLARLGTGIAVLDELMARDDVADGLLLPILQGWTLPPTPISIMTPTRLLPAKTRAFVDMIADAVSGMVGLAG